MQNPLVSAYIPCHNDAETLAQAIRSVQEQTFPVEELFVIDDGSTDASVEAAKQMGVTVHTWPNNLGRGAARHKAMLEARHDLVLCCDSSKSLAPSFVERALKWFEDDRVAAVCGRILQRAPSNVVERWRGRHLFRTSLPAVLGHGTFISAGALVKKPAVLQVGNFDPALTHSEDRELGERLQGASFEIIDDPELEVYCNDKNDLWQVFERYWRWHGGVRQDANVQAYLKQIYYSLGVMAVDDLKEGDWLSVPISLLSPHYQFWRSTFGKSSLENKHS